jgi:hypothetical protein
MAFCKFHLKGLIKKYEGETVKKKTQTGYLICAIQFSLLLILDSGANGHIVC